ncbi:DNA alkylation repair protein [Staphylococcus phage JPL-50]|uniref:DNA alkylation repair protein n=1 Tax=Staphylococcus phage JPL-50 TaxID=2851077 RepID=A0A8F3C9U0_9CAUD|nr:DNA alkylation repair protein [Staphylococcus phage JPL-50]QWY14511.1 DNA alkylation repair protein [Staphylococcus phage JPL-50]
MIEQIIIPIQNHIMIIFQDYQSSLKY